MKKTPLHLVILNLFAITCFAINVYGQPAEFKQQQTNGISFTENKGQVHDQNYQARPDVLYGVMAGNMVVHIKNNGVSYQLNKVDRYKEVVNQRNKKKEKKVDQQTIYRIDLRWLNCNSNFTRTEDGVLAGHSNYYLETCPTGALNVKSYIGVTLHNLYNGIALHYYEKKGELKHDYIVAPHADYKQIQIEVEGAEITVNKDGSLILNTPLGKVQEGAPIVYQSGRQLTAKWKIKNSVLSFDIQNYNPNYEIIIDPVTRLWGTYYGGMGGDFGTSCSTDASGSVYIAGLTEASSGTVFATSGSHQLAYGGGNADAFLVKFNSNGVRQWSTYYGGTGDDYGYACATDGSGNIYLAGETSSASGTVITTPGSHQSAYGAGNTDAFLVKFNANGVRQWATYYGGTGHDSGYSCTTDASGNVYLTGPTNSTVGIVTVGSHQTVFNGGALINKDAFLVKFNTSGTRLWGTYYGGTGDEDSYACSTDATGNVYLAGATDTGTGTTIATSGSHQSAYGGNALRDAFLVKFNANGIRQWGSYYGGAGYDWSYSCATDASGNVYMAGYTNSSTGTVIATSGSHQSAYGGNEDAFLVKFNANGSRQWATYYGGSGDDEAGSCRTDAAGNIFLAGLTDTNTGTVIATGGSHQSVHGGNLDGFLVKFGANGIRQWGTYYGGVGDDTGTSCAIDAVGNLYLTGSTDSNTGTVIATPSSHQPVYGGTGTDTDAFLVKFNNCINLNPVAASTASFCSGSNISLSVSISGTLSPTYNWVGPNTFTSAIQNPIINNAGVVNSGVYTVTVNNAGCIETATTLVTNANPTITLNSGAICNGQSFTLVASGATTYTFNQGPIVSPTVTSSYSVTGTAAPGCTASAVTTVFVNLCTGLYENSATQGKFNLYPNPVKTIMNLESDSDCVMIILNALGQIVYSSKLDAGKHEINLASFEKGIYLVKIENKAQSKNFRMIKD